MASTVASSSGGILYSSPAAFARACTACRITLSVSLSPPKHQTPTQTQSTYPCPINSTFLQVFMQLTNDMVHLQRPHQRTSFPASVADVMSKQATQSNTPTPQCATYFAEDSSCSDSTRARLTAASCDDKSETCQGKATTMQAMWEGSRHVPALAWFSPWQQ